MHPVVHIGSLAIYTFGLIFGLSVCLGVFAFDRYFELYGVRVSMPVLGAITVGAGFAGAKLDHTLIFWTGHSSGVFASHLLNLKGGYTYLGCVLVGSIASLIYFKVNHISLLRAFDSLFCIGLAYGVGRIGCLLAGDGDYGIPSNMP